MSLLMQVQDAACRPALPGPPITWARDRVSFKRRSEQKSFTQVTQGTLNRTQVCRAEVPPATWTREGLKSSPLDCQVGRVPGCSHRGRFLFSANDPCDLGQATN